MSDTNSLMVCGILLIWGTAILILVTEIIFGKMYERRFFIAVRESLDVKDYELQKCIESIRNAYEVYRRYRYVLTSEKIVPMCQKYALNLRIKTNLGGVQLHSKDVLVERLQKVIKQLQYEEQFDDEKANEIIVELSGKVSTESIGKVKQKLIYLEAYHKGVLSVKNMEILELKDKLQRKRWITWVSGTVGIIGSVASIVSIFV